jgi:hypothetical protein
MSLRAHSCANWVLPMSKSFRLVFNHERRRKMYVVVVVVVVVRARV